MGRHFGGYRRIQYEVWEKGATKPNHPYFDLWQMIEDCNAEAAGVLDKVLNELKSRWP
jgi:hypothetical protein